MKKILFYDSKPWDIEFFNRANKYGYSLDFTSERLSKETAPLSAGYDSICLFVNDDLGSEVADILFDNRISLIALRCSGYDRVNLKSLYKRIPVVRVPSYSPSSIAEHTVALLLSLKRKIHKSYNRTREMNFSISDLMCSELYGNTVGLIGTGSIGSSVARILKSFGMRVIGFSPSKTSNAPIDFVDLEYLYSESDVISLHCPMTPQTKHIINSESISRMKDGVTLLNTSRGGLVKTIDLIDGLKESKIGSAGLDVYEDETNFFTDSSTNIVKDDILARLLTFPNVIITSHQAFFTSEAMSRISDVTLSNINMFFNLGITDNEIRYSIPKPEEFVNTSLVTL